jgi:anti-sigma factor RsiW
VTCRECSEFLSDYLDGELDLQIRAVFERHLAACPNCVIYLEQFSATVKAGRQAYADEADPQRDAVPEELIRAILASRRA